jgi:hypothetical protein
MIFFLTEAMTTIGEMRVEDYEIRKEPAGPEGTDLVKFVRPIPKMPKRK